MPKLSEMMKMSPGEFFSTLRSNRKPEQSVVQPQPGTDLAVAGQPALNAALPNVNLLPDEYPERVRANQSIIYFVLGLVVLLVITGIAAAGGSLANFLHKTQLQQAQSVGQSLQQQVNGLQGYSTYEQSISTERNLMYTALKSDINMPSILSSVSSNANRYNVSFTAISLTVNGAGSGATGTTGTGNASCAADPFTGSNSIGCISLTGTAPNYESASQFFAQLNKTKGFVNGTLATQSNQAGATGGNNFSFQGSVAITSSFYSNKYNSLSVPLAVLLGQDSSTPSAAATPRASSTPSNSPAPTATRTTPATPNITSSAPASPSVTTSTNPAGE